MEEIKIKGLNETIYFYETKTGLKIYMWVNEKINSMYASLSVKYGSNHTKFKVGKKIYEVPGGIAHFLEHIKFNIDEETTAHDKFYKLGGDSNAFTTFDYTSYLVWTTQNKKENLEELINFVYNHYFTKKTISKERGIILEEARMGLDDPYDVVFYDTLENTLQKSKYRNRVIGTLEEIEAITLEDIKLIFDTFYHPKNMVLTITGNFNPYEMASVVENALSKIEFLEYKNPTAIIESEPKKVTKKYSEKMIKITYPLVKIALKMDMLRFKNYSKIDLKILISLLITSNFGATSDFKDELMEKGLIENLMCGRVIYDDTLVIYITSTTKYPDEFIKRVKDKLNNLQISEADFKRKKNAAIATLILDYEDIENVNYDIQCDILYNGGIVTNLKEIYENKRLEDIDNIIKLMDVNNISVNVFKPKENQKDE